MKTLPTFKRNEFDKALNKSSHKNILKDFDTYCQLTAKPVKTKDMVRNVFKFLIVSNKRTDKLDIEDLRKFLLVLKTAEVSGLTKNDMRVHVQKFLRWNFKDWSERFDEFRDIKESLKEKPEKNRDTKKIVRDLEKPHEEIVKDLIEGENKLYWKLFLVMNYEMGMRPGEVRNFEKEILKKRKGRYEAILKMTKTKKEKPLIFSQRFTKLYERFEKEKHNQKIESKYIFPSPKNPLNSISKSSVNIWFRRLTQRVLGKNLYPNILRHMRGTDYDKMVREGKISLTNASQTMGHSEKIFTSTYAHTKEEDILDILAEQLYGEDLTPERKSEIEKDVEHLKKGEKLFLRHQESVDADMKKVLKQIAEFKKIASQLKNGN